MATKVTEGLPCFYRGCSFWTDQFLQVLLWAILATATSKPLTEADLKRGGAKFDKTFRFGPVKIKLVPSSPASRSSPVSSWASSCFNLSTALYVKGPKNVKILMKWIQKYIPFVPRAGHKTVDHAYFWRFGNVTLSVEPLSNISNSCRIYILEFENQSFVLGLCKLFSCPGRYFSNCR